MKRILLFAGIALIVLLANQYSYGQPLPVRIHEHKINNLQVELRADNEAHFPISVVIKASIKNMTATTKWPLTLVIPPKSKDFLVSTLTAKPQKAYGYQFEFSAHMGDILIDHYDEEYLYALPYDHSKSFIIAQGYQGAFSHQGENALDFNMPEGTQVLAARGGIVVQVVDLHSRSCPHERCNDFNNILTILHEDGTMAEYVHIKKNGALVSLGQKVTKGEAIALSGKTGWTTGPHLHFVVILPKMGGRDTLKTKFEITTDEGAYLEEGKWY